MMLVVVWAFIFAAGFVLPRFIEPTGDGFTRGTNRLPYVFALHCLGLIIAIITAGVALRTKAEIAVWLLLTGFVPLVVYILMIGLLLVVFSGAMFSGM